MALFSNPYYWSSKIAYIFMKGVAIYHLNLRNGTNRNVIRKEHNYQTFECSLYKTTAHLLPMLDCLISFSIVRVRIIVMDSVWYCIVRDWKVWVFLPTNDLSYMTTCQNWLANKIKPKHAFKVTQNASNMFLQN